MSSKLPRISVVRVLKLKDKLVSDIELTGFVGIRLQKEVFEDFVGLLADKLHKQVQQRTIYASLQHLAGTELTRPLYHKIMWRLAGNVDRLKRGLVTPDWLMQVSKEWVPIKVLSCEKKVTRYGKPGAEFTSAVLAGTPTAEVMKHFWTNRMGFVVADRLGFSKPYGNTPYKDISQFVEMQLYVEIDPDLCDGSPRFDRFAVSSTQKKINQDILKLRYRTSGFKCPKGYPENKDCHLCWVGLDQCPAATHGDSYIRKHCDGCKQDALFDPERPRQPLCVNCHTRNLRKNISRTPVKC